MLERVYKVLCRRSRIGEVGRSGRGMEGEGGVTVW